MKKLILTLLIVNFSLFIAMSQSQQAFKYQATVRTKTGTLVINKDVAFKISVLRNNVNGPVVYSETQIAKTNNYGLANLNIGRGTPVSGTFSTITWGTDSYFLKIEFDENAGSNYTTMGTSELLSVPFALYAVNAGNSGTSGSSGTTGPTGPAGPTGPPGATGVSGMNGLPGLAGTTGQTGPTGSTGMIGLAGLPGSKGDTGPTGTTGPSGIDGQRGNPGTPGATGPTGPLMDGQTKGTMLYFDNGQWNLLKPGKQGDVLTLDNGIPKWTALDGVSDIDGNSYTTVVIGPQTWMVENLKVTKYRNGDPIPLVNDNTAWSTFLNGAYCNYNNDTAIAKVYGHLYNWQAIKDNRLLCPAKWHIPTDQEWNALYASLGGSTIAGGKMKEKGTTHWLMPNSDATNESGFTALPGGSRGSDGNFTGIGTNANWWLPSELNTANAWCSQLIINNPQTNSNYTSKATGFSVRCIKD